LWKTRASLRRRISSVSSLSLVHAGAEFQELPLVHVEGRAGGGLPATQRASTLVIPPPANTPTNKCIKKRGTKDGAGTPIETALPSPSAVPDAVFTPSVKKRRRRSAKKSPSPVAVSWLQVRPTHDCDCFQFICSASRLRWAEPWGSSAQDPWISHLKMRYSTLDAIDLFSGEEGGCVEASW
jgi:hypothetical protein